MKKEVYIIIGVFVSIAIIISSIILINKSDEKIEKVQRKEIETTESTTASPAGITDELLTLVNFENSIPENWTVDPVDIQNGKQIDRRAYDDLQKMLDDAKSAGLDPFICSAYRSQEKQEELFNRKVNQYLDEGNSEEEAEKLAQTWVSVPGTSEHQLGLALDIVSAEYQDLDESQENTETQKWLMANSYKYGFILRYPTDKKEITGVNYEPWHYRYVGKENAKKIYASGLCLEEYLQTLQ